MKWALIVILLGWAGLATAQDGSTANNPTDWKTQFAESYRPVTRKQRLQWFSATTAGPLSLLVTGSFVAAWGTMLNSPKEYDTHRKGFGKRYSMRLTGLSTGNAMEASVGALWGEDPRYFPSPTRGFGPRLKCVIRSSFVAPGRDGRWHPAYARFAGNVGNNFLSSTWRAPSENDPRHAAMRCAWGVLGGIAETPTLNFGLT